MSYGGYGALAGGAIGGAFGGPVGIPIGMALGGQIGSMFEGSNQDGRGKVKRLMDIQQALPHKAIQWRAADARKAGLHPLATMGVPLSGGSVGSPVGTSPEGSSWLDGAGMAARIARQFARPRAAADLAESAARTDMYAAEAELARARSRSVAMKASEPTRSGEDSFVLPVAGRVGVDPHVSTSNQVQERYGDIVENAYGTFLLGSDITKGLYKHWKRNVGSARPRGIRRGRHPDTDTYLGGS